MVRRGTSAAREPKRASPSAGAAHLFFTGYMTIICAIIFLGFAPSFYLRGLAPSAAPLAPLRWDMAAHGVLASLFMLAFPAQSWLAARGRMNAHIAVGKWAFVLGALLVPLGYLVGARAYHAERPVPIPADLVEAFVALPLFGSAFLGLALWLAWRHRFNGAAHKRMMVCIACQMADPAIFRLPIFEMGPAGIAAIQGLMLATLLPLWLWDFATMGRIHRGTVVGSAIFASELCLRTLIMPTGAWAGLVHSLPLYGLR